MTRVLISVAQLAARTSTSEAFWRARIAAGELPVVRLGRSVRIDEATVALLLECGGIRHRKTAISPARVLTSREEVR